MVTFKQKGNFRKTILFFEKIIKNIQIINFDKYGLAGVEALKAATPKKTGRTANSWNYRIIRKMNRTSIEWYNTNINEGVNIALIIQYGHGTRNGAYIQGIDYINPVTRPLFKQIADESWKEVVK